MSGAVPDRGAVASAAAIAAVVALIAYAGASKVGVVGMLVPLALVIVGVILQRPTAAMMLLLTLVIVCEGVDFGLFQFTSHLYANIAKGVTLLDAPVAIAILAVAIDIVGSRRRTRVPRPLVPAVVTLLLGMVSGAVVGHGNGASLHSVIASQTTLVYLLLLPLAVANMNLSRRRMRQILEFLMALAILKALLGLAEVASHHGIAIEGHERLTYFEPTANWVMMIALLAVCGALAAKVKLPRWMLLGTPLMLASLVLSYRRSFWIAAIVGVVVVVLVALSPGRRRVLLAVALLVIVAVWSAGTLSIQSQSPVVKRITSLSPTKLEHSTDATYRNYERTNVLRAIAENPVTGLGMKVPWAATATVLPLEQQEGREYVEVAALWFWLKLGIIGLFAYIFFIAGALLTAWRVWRGDHEPVLRVFGLASFGGILGLIPIEVTATFTGVEARFTVVFAMQVGLLALLASAGGGQPGEASVALASGERELPMPSAL
ncbi:MAG: O-antigen ligase family protein [Solirubrobacteraceae bacterium]